MAVDHVPEQEAQPLSSKQDSFHATRFLVIFLALAGLAVGEIYTLHRVGDVHSSVATVATDQAKLNKTYADQLSERIAATERTNAQRLETLKAELAAEAKRMGSTGKALNNARSMVTKLEKDQAEQTEALKQEIEKKADEQQVAALTQDVSGTKTDLAITKQNLDTLSKDFGMSKTEFGTLIARNHDEIDQLRKLGDRDYFEFTLDRNHPQRVGGVGLELKKVNVRRHRFNLNLTADDMQIEKKDRTVNEPVFFYVAGSKRPFELVVNKVQSDKVVGYISTPKGAVQTQMASRSEVGR